MLNKFKNILLSSLLGISAVASAADNCWQQTCCTEDACCEGKFTVGADWLSWKVTEDNLSVGQIFNIDTETISYNFERLNQKFNYDNGFRAYVGYEPACSSWGVDVVYTYLPSNASTCFKSDETNLFLLPNSRDYPIFDVFDFPLESNGFDLFSSVSSKWNLNLNNLDVDFGRSFCLASCFKIRPHIGFRTTWFDQKLRFSGIAADVEGETPIVPEWTIKQKFRGYGIEGGLWAEWEVACGISLVGHVGGSVLYSKSDVNQKGIITQADNDLRVNLNEKDTVRNGTPTLEYFAGIQYSSQLCDFTYNIYAGWEQHVLFNVNKMAWTGSGNISTSGLTLGLNFGF